MEFRPETFSLGVIDLFSVLLPGATLTCALLKVFQERLCALLPRCYELSEVAQWAMFLFVSYLLGHYIFLLGAKLDDWIYDPLRKAPSEKSLKGRLADRLFGTTRDLAVSHVEKQLPKSDEWTPGKNEHHLMNAFQWAKARLAIQSPAALLDVQRLEADSKFFRSFVVVLAILTLGFFYRAIIGQDTQTSLGSIALCLLLLFLSGWRYVERRFKATQQVYWYVIVIDRFPPPSRESIDRT